MRRLCPTRLALLLLAGLFPGVSIACSSVDGEPPPSATPTRAESLGIEIAQTYGELLLTTQALVEPRPLAPEAKERLRLLREEYKVRFGNYACLRAGLGEAQQAAVAGSFDTYRGSFGPQDMAWFDDAASDYDLEDSAIRQRLEEIRTLDDFAFLERVAVSRPGQELLCGG